MPRASLPAPRHAVAPHLQRKRNRMGNRRRHLHTSERSPGDTRSGTPERGFSGSTGCCAAHHPSEGARRRSTMPEAPSRSSLRETVEAAIHIGAELGIAGGCGCRKGTDDDIRALGDPRQRIRTHGFESPTHGVAHHSGAHLLADDESEPRGSVLARRQHRGDDFGSATTGSASNDQAIVAPAGHTKRAGEHRDLRGELGAALRAASRKDRTAGAGAHAKTEAVLLGATTVVGLEGALAHENHSGNAATGIILTGDIGICHSGISQPIKGTSWRRAEQICALRTGHCQDPHSYYPQPVACTYAQHARGFPWAGCRSQPW